MSFAYIIATYSGSDHHHNGALSEDVLDIQIMTLIRWLQNNPNAKHHPTDIVVVCPSPKSSSSSSWPRYYRWEEWTNTIRNTGVEIGLHSLQYVGDNKHHSYDQYLQGVEAFPGMDHYLFIEDDYTIDPSNSTVFEDMFQIYDKLFGDETIGILSSWWSDDHTHGFHAAISNSLVSGKTMEKLSQTNSDKGTPLQRLYAYRGILPQVAFSRLFLHSNIPVGDYRKWFDVKFWDSSIQSIRECGLEDRENDKNIFIPVQILPEIEERLNPKPSSQMS